MLRGLEIDGMDDGRNGGRIVRAGACDDAEVRLSVVVATMNEPAGEWIGRIREAVAPLDAELILVDDSDPATRAALRATAAPARVLDGAGWGKGAAIRRGILASRGDVVLTADADVDAEHLARIPEFMATIERGEADVVIAERHGPGPYRGVVRLVLSVGLLLAQRLLIFQSRRFHDTQCGFKAYRGDVARALAERQTVAGGMYDIEHLYIAVRRGLKIAQVPVRPMTESRPSRISVLRCMLHDPVDLLRVKWNGLRGWYER